MRKKIVLIIMTCFLTFLTACGSTENIVKEDALEEITGELNQIDASNITSVNTIIYSTLNNKQKDIYNSLLTCYKNFDISVKLSGTEDDIKIAHKAIIADHPEIFYVNGYVTDASSGALIHLSKDFNLFPNYLYSKEEADEELSKIDDKVNELLAPYEDKLKNADDYTKSKIAFDIIVQNITYNQDITQNQNIYSAFIKKKSVCGGYSQGYSYLLQKMNIPSAMITGNLNDVAHSWNISVLDNAYYMTDTTNGDSYYKINEKKLDYIDYSYLNIDPNYMPAYAVSAMYSNFMIEDVTDNYYHKEALYIETFTDEQIDAGVNKAYENDMPYITFRFDERPLETAKEKLLDLEEMQSKYNVTHVKLLEDFGTITLYFGDKENTAKQED